MDTGHCIWKVSSESERYSEACSCIMHNDWLMTHPSWTHHWMVAVAVGLGVSANRTERKAKPAVLGSDPDPDPRSVEDLGSDP